MRDTVLTALLVVGLAFAFTTHVGLAGRILLRQRPRWRGPVALFVPPLALVWALRAGWKGLAGLWIGAVAVYVIALVVALAGG